MSDNRHEAYLAKMVDGRLELALYEKETSGIGIAIPVDKGGLIKDTMYIFFEDLEAIRTLKGMLDLCSDSLLEEHESALNAEIEELHKLLESQIQK